MKIIKVKLDNLQTMGTNVKQPTKKEKRRSNQQKENGDNEMFYKDFRGQSRK